MNWSIKFYPILIFSVTYKIEYRDCGLETEQYIIAVVLFDRRVKNFKTHLKIPVNQRRTDNKMAIRKRTNNDLQNTES